MRSLNRVFLIGHVGRDPDLREIGNGRRVANFSMATNMVWRDASGQRQERTEWHRIAAFGNLADIAERMIRKGRYIMVEGRIQTRRFTDRSGQDRYITEIVAQNIIILEPRGEDYSRIPPDIEPPPVLDDIDNGANGSATDEEESDLDFLL